MPLSVPHSERKDTTGHNEVIVALGFKPDMDLVVGCIVSPQF
jgi:hypothetical protein